MVRTSEEAAAHSLGRELERELGPRSVTVIGAGDLWQCIAQQGPRRSSTVCLWADGVGAEYLTHFQASRETVAWGRSMSSTRVSPGQ